MNITTVGLDLAKNVSHDVCSNQTGKIVRKKVLRRSQILHFFSKLSPTWLGLNRVRVLIIGQEKLGSSSMSLSKSRHSMLSLMFEGIKRILK